MTDVLKEYYDMKKKQSKILGKYINMVYITKEKLIPEKEFTGTIFKNLKIFLTYIDNNFIDFDGYMYWTFDFSIK